MYLEDKKTGEALMRDVLEWVKKRDPEEHYNWSDADNCACAKYAKEKGRFKEWRAGTSRAALRGHDAAVWSTLNHLACPLQPYMLNSMGKFAENLEKALA